MALVMKMALGHCLRIVTGGEDISQACPLSSNALCRLYRDQCTGQSYELTSEVCLEPQTGESFRTMMMTWSLQGLRTMMMMMTWSFAP